MASPRRTVSNFAGRSARSIAHKISLKSANHLVKQKKAAKKNMLDSYVQKTIDRAYVGSDEPMINYQTRGSSAPLIKEMNLDSEDEQGPRPKIRTSIEEHEEKMEEFRNYALLNGKLDSFHQVLEQHNDEASLAETLGSLTQDEKE